MIGNPLLPTMKSELSNKDPLIRNILKYLGYPPNAETDQELLSSVEHALEEVAQKSNFQSVYAHFNRMPNDFPSGTAYNEYLSDSSEYLLCAYTLGSQIDRHLKRLQITNMTDALLFDAAASAYLEMLADEFDNSLPFSPLGFRFCPGYGGTSICDNQEIAAQLHAERIGITFLDSGLMVPMKSMMGIIRIGGKASAKSCQQCTLLSDCPFRAKGTHCYAR